MLLVPLLSFCLEAATRRVEDLVFHEAVETMGWQEETEEDSHEGFGGKRFGSVVDCVGVGIVPCFCGVSSVRAALELGYATMSSFQKTAQGTFVTA